MTVIISSLLILLCPPVEKKAASKLPLGKDTTYITEPLDKDGYLDYEAALNERHGKGVRSDKNAVVLLWRAIGPHPDGDKGMPAEFFKRLGIDEPPERGDYFLDLYKYLRDEVKLEFDDNKVVSIDQLSIAVRRPWTAKDYPHIAAWLKANEKPLDLVVEASKRPEYFNPIVCILKVKEPGLIFNVVAPGPLKCWQIARALTSRAMLEVGEGKFEDAWADLLACHRLGRLFGRGAWLFDSLYGFAIQGVATNPTLAYLEHSGLKAKEIQARLKQIQRLSPMVPLAGKLETAERFLYLDTVQLVRRGSHAILDWHFNVTVDAKVQKALDRVDFEPALRLGNKWYDRTAAAMRLKDRADRVKAFDKIEADLDALKLDDEAPDLGKMLLDKNTQPKKIGQTVGEVLLRYHRLVITGSHKFQNSFDRCQQVQRNLEVAFALAAYRSDKGTYPAKLDDLAPKYLATVPGDLFSGKGLIYKPSEKGYLLYSVGVNGKDDEGRSEADDPPADDVVVRMPLPELKPKK